jgi:hypothetical protein
MNALDGSWVAMQILTKMMPVNIEAMTEGKIPNLPGNRSQMNEEEFHNLQNHCLRVVSRYERDDAPPIPIMVGNGVLAVKELETDIITIMVLTVHSLIFNVAPFFEEGALSEVMQGFPAGLSPLSQ